MDTPNFYSNFKKICESYGMSPKEAAEQNGIGKSTLAAWKKGSTPKNETLIKLSEYFEVPIATFFQPGGPTNEQIVNTLNEVVLEEEQVRLSELFLIRWENICSGTTDGFVSPSIITDSDVKELAQFRKYIQCYRRQLAVKRETAYYSDCTLEGGIIQINDILFSPDLTVAEVSRFMWLIQKALGQTACNESECPSKSVL